MEGLGSLGAPVALRTLVMKVRNKGWRLAQTELLVCPCSMKMEMKPYPMKWWFGRTSHMRPRGQPRSSGWEQASHDQSPLFRRHIASYDQPCQPYPSIYINPSTIFISSKLLSLRVLVVGRRMVWHFATAPVGRRGVPLEGEAGTPL